MPTTSNNARARKIVVKKGSPFPLVTLALLMSLLSPNFSVAKTKADRPGDRKASTQKTQKKKKSRSLASTKKKKRSPAEAEDSKPTDNAPSVDTTAKTQQEKPAEVIPTEFHAKLGPETKERIKELTWDVEGKLDSKTGENEATSSLKSATTANKSNDLLVKTREEGHANPFYVILDGTYPSKFQLVYLGIPVERKEDGKFQIEVPISGEENHLLLNTVDLHGKIETEARTIQFPAWAAFQKAHEKPASNEKKWFVSPGIAFTYLNYSQPSLPKLAEWLTTVKVAGGYNFSEKWNVSASVFYTPLTISSSLPGLELQFLGSNLRFGYQAVKNPSFELTVAAGWYYNSSFSLGRPFGYRDVGGPQLYPVLRFLIGKEWLTSYVKFSPVLGEGTFFALYNTEFAIGASYPVYDKLSVTLDMSHLSVQVPRLGIAQADTYGLGASYHF